MSLFEAMPIGPYVSRPNEQALSSPLRWSGVRFFHFQLRADADRLQARVDRYLNRPLGARRRYQVLGTSAILHFTSITEWRSTTEDFGFFSKQRAGVWIPITCADWKDEPVGFFPCWEFIDLGVARSTGREVFGVPFDLAEISFGVEPAVGADTDPLVAGTPYGFTVATTVLDALHPDRISQEVSLIRAQRRAGARSVARCDHALLPGLIRLVNLKQVRSERDMAAAAYQAVIEMPFRLALAGCRRLPGDYQLHIKKVQSHPIAAALGLAPEAFLGLEGHLFDFAAIDVLAATEIVPARAAGAIPLRELGAHPAEPPLVVMGAGGRRAPPEPPYVDELDVDSPPAPYESGNARLYGFVLDADVRKLQRICDRFFGEPTRGAVEYRAFIPAVLAYFAIMREASTTTRGPGTSGVLQYQEAGFWIPMVRVVNGEAKYFVTFPYYTFLDNAFGMSTGREVYGMYKELASLDVPTDAEDGGFVIRPTVLDPFGLSTLAERQTLITMSPILGSRGGQLRNLVHASELAAEGIANLCDMGIAVSPELAVDLTRTLVRRRPRFAFLKQFRHANRSGQACYQAVVEADFDVQEVRRLRPLPGVYDLLINDYDSHRVAADLGLTSNHQHDLRGFVLDMAFVFENGKVIWRR